MIALLDCNNFTYLARDYFPKLNNRPVVVLSNNDGCVISRSNEAKKMGIVMGEPFFKIKIIENMKIEVLSSNYALYADISDRIMSILKKNFLEVEVYSIDEAFNLNYNDEKAICSELSEKILKWTGFILASASLRPRLLQKYLIE